MYERAVGEEVKVNGRGTRRKGKERRLGTPQRLENIVPATIDERDKGKREKKGERGRDKDE